MGDRYSSASALGAPARHRIAPHERARVLEQVFRIVLRYFARVGTTPTESRAAFRLASRRSRRLPFRYPDARRYALWSALAELLRVWHRERRYVDSDGAPRPLPLHGPHSFAEITRRFLPTKSPTRLAQFLIGAGVLFSRDDGRLMPRRRDVVIRELTAMSLERVPVVVQGFLSTLAYNLQPKPRRGNGRLECASESSEIQELLVPSFDRYCLKRGQAFVTDIDNWIAQRVRTARRGRPLRTARVAVNAFASVESSPSSRTRRRSG